MGEIEHRRAERGLALPDSLPDPCRAKCPSSCPNPPTCPLRPVLGRVTHQAGLAGLEGNLMNINMEQGYWQSWAH